VASSIDFARPNETGRWIFGKRLATELPWLATRAWHDGMRGRFITFEGGEGTGKSTHGKLLRIGSKDWASAWS
jgi:hypothetical protein